MLPMDEEIALKNQQEFNKRLEDFNTAIDRVMEVECAATKIFLNEFIRMQMAVLEFKRALKEAL